uniref:Putative ovule protein n=1 Tax=Solanum chacoense TaxID=4108 RepID=A0A0V0HWA5_SOLCH
MGEFPKRINIGMRKKTGEINEKWITIKYDYVPKYCKTCKLQGHDEKECFIIHPELYPKEEDEEANKRENKNTEGEMEQEEEGTERSRKGKGKIGESNAFQEQRRKNGYRKGGFFLRGKLERVWNPKQQQNDQVITTNKFEALGDTESVPKEGEHKNGEELPTKKDTTRENMGQDETAVVNNEKIKIPVISKSKDSHADTYSGVKDSANRDIGALSSVPSSVQILENEGGINQRSDERKKNDDEGPHTGQEEGHSQTGESDTHNRVQEILKAPAIDKLTEQEKTKKKDTEEDECMQRNIESIGREGDLSPRQINQLQGKNKKGEKLQTQSQINTRSKKGSTSTINQ